MSKPQTPETKSSAAEAKQAAAEANPHAAAEATCKLFEGIYHDYLRRLGEIWDGTSRRILEAQTRFGESATAALQRPADMQKAYEAAQQAYADAVRAAWDESQQQYSDAYADFLGGHRDAWAKVQPKDLSPGMLAMIAQSAGIAAGYAGSTIGNWSLVAWAGVPPGSLSPAKPA